MLKVLPIFSRYSPELFLPFDLCSVKCHLFLYGDYSCLVGQHKDINEIEKQLNVDFSNMFW